MQLGPLRLQLDKLRRVVVGERQDERVDLGLDGGVGRLKFCDLGLEAHQIVVEGAVLTALGQVGGGNAVNVELKVVAHAEPAGGVQSEGDEPDVGLGATVRPRLKVDVLGFRMELLEGRTDEQAHQFELGSCGEVDPDEPGLDVQVGAVRVHHRIPDGLAGDNLVAEGARTDERCGAEVGRTDDGGGLLGRRLRMRAGDEGDEQ